jgi:hypothetical protein
LVWPLLGQCMPDILAMSVILLCPLVGIIAFRSKEFDDRWHICHVGIIMSGSCWRLWQWMPAWTWKPHGHNNECCEYPLGIFYLGPWDLLNVALASPEWRTFSHGHVFRCADIYLSRLIRDCYVSTAVCQRGISKGYCLLCWFRHGTHSKHDRKMRMLSGNTIPCRKHTGFYVPRSKWISEYEAHFFTEFAAYSQDTW